ncbi:hypothetical protein ERHA55_15230 [Erwinia rhapontici]|nr:hypothetical protein ERHA55_15230 [Erwinia rhapontici]
MNQQLSCDHLWYGADIVTMQDGRYSIIEQGAIAVSGEEIVWLGPYTHSAHIAASQRTDLGGGSSRPVWWTVIRIWCLGAIAAMSLNNV